MNIITPMVALGVAATLAACATLTPEPNEDQIERAVAAKFQDLRGLAALVPGLPPVSGLVELQGLRKQRCTAAGEERRPAYVCTVTLELKTLLGTLHPSLDLRFIEGTSGWVVADLP